MTLTENKNNACLPKKNTQTQVLISGRQSTCTVPADFHNYFLRAAHVSGGIEHSGVLPVCLTESIKLVILRDKTGLQSSRQEGQRNSNGHSDCWITNLPS